MIIYWYCVRRNKTLVVNEVSRDETEFLSILPIIVIQMLDYCTKACAKIAIWTIPIKWHANTEHVSRYISVPLCVCVRACAWHKETEKDMMMTNKVKHVVTYIFLIKFLKYLCFQEQYSTECIKSNAIYQGFLLQTQHYFVFLVDTESTTVLNSTFGKYLKA